MHVAVLGAGDMGHGLAVHFALQGATVSLADHRESNLAAARERMREAVAFLRERGVTDRDPDAALGDVAFTTDLVEAVGETDLVIESVSEDLEAKRTVFEDLAAAAPADAILASNTSGIPVTDIAEAVPGAAERVVGCHWWYPPYLLRPVEVVRGTNTADGTIERLETILEAADRDPVLVERDVPGFVWNRVQFAVFRECLHLVAEGVASIADVNRAIRDGYAIRTAAIGPFETMDVAGLDLVETVGRDLYPHLATDDEPQAPLVERVAAGETGIEAGVGFFEYDEPTSAVTRRRDEQVAAIRAALDAEGAGPDCG